MILDLALNLTRSHFFKTMKGGNWDVAEIYKFEVKSNQLLLQRVKTDWENFEHQFDNEVIVLEKI